MLKKLHSNTRDEVTIDNITYPYLKLNVGTFAPIGFELFETIGDGEGALEVLSNLPPYLFDKVFLMGLSCVLDGDNLPLGNEENINTYFTDNPSIMVALSFKILQKHMRDLISIQRVLTYLEQVNETVNIDLNTVESRNQAIREKANTRGSRKFISQAESILGKHIFSFQQWAISISQSEYCSYSYTQLTEDFDYLDFMSEANRVTSLDNIKEAIKSDQEAKRAREEMSSRGGK